MSYGRSPHYIYSDGACVHFHQSDGSSAHVSEEALAQFIARLAARGTENLMAWVQEGVRLAPDHFSPDFRVTVTGGWRDGDGDD